MSTELLNRADAVINKLEMPERNTYFALKNFIIGKEPTVQGQLWQIVRELQSRRETIDSIEMQLDEQADNLEAIDIQLMKQTQKVEATENVSDLDFRLHQIDIRKAERRKLAIEKSIQKLKNRMKYILEEVEYLVKAFTNLSKVQEMKPLDDVQAQKEYWNEKCAEELNLKLLLKNPLSTEFVSTILALDDDSPVKKHVLQMLQNVQQLMVQEGNRQKITKTG